jgi:hypothetical protein
LRATIVLFFPLALWPVAVHTYCEARWIAVAFGGASLAIAIGLIGARGGSRIVVVVKFVGLFACVPAVASNVALIRWAIGLCG